ncbi:hypothetical protein COB57_06285, partial [Candidatus Peregrinibacteria bacterium]
AAFGGLKPSSVQWLRGTYPHLKYRLLDTRLVLLFATTSLFCHRQHTVPPLPDVKSLFASLMNSFVKLTFVASIILD